MDSEGHASSRPAEQRDLALRLEILNGLLNTLTDVLDIREVFDQVSQLVQRVLPHDLMGVMEISQGGDRMRLIPTTVLSMVFVASITGVLLQSDVVSESYFRHLSGAVAAYLFIGILWGMAYSFVDSLAPGSLHAIAETGHRLVWTDYIFFSFVALTTVGYGDVVAVGGIRGLVMLEGIIGAMYPAILIGRLLTLYRPSRDTSALGVSHPFPE